MIYGIGTDIVSINRIETLFLKFGKKFISKILSKQEQEKFNSLINSSKKLSYLSTRWAAKEALVKALGTGFRDGCYLTNISVLNNKLGKPEFSFTDDLSNKINFLTNHTNYKIHLSLSDEKQHALAFVIVELS